MTSCCTWSSAKSYTGVRRNPRKAPMAELIGRTLRDGRLAGEHAPAVTIKDSVASSFGLEVFDELLTQLAGNIAAGKAQSKGVVIVSMSRSPSRYGQLLKQRALDIEKCGVVFDCYSDPLGWKEAASGGVDEVEDVEKGIKLVRDMRDLGNLMDLIVEGGGRLVGNAGGKFSVGIDCASEMLRYVNVSVVADFLSKLRSLEVVSSVFWVVRSELCDERSVNVFDYLSSVVGCLGDGSGGRLDVGAMREMNLRRGKFSVRFKLRNGRVKIVTERFEVEKSGVKFMPMSSTDGGVVGSQEILPKLQFNIRLSDKEKDDRAQVVLPFEHQGKGEPIWIYDGRKSLQEEKGDNGIHVVEKIGVNGESAGKGEIIYLRDSDDEMPDSDEDPDDDLDI